VNAVTFAIVLSSILDYLTYRYIEKLRYIKHTYVPVVLWGSILGIGLVGVYV